MSFFARWLRTLAVIILAACLAGCGGSGEAPIPSSVPARGEASAPAQRWTRPTEEEMQDLAQKAEQAMEARDAAAFNALVDWDAIFDRVTRDVDAPAEFAQGFRNGATGTVKSPGGFAGQIAAQLGTDGSYRLLRIHEDRGEPRALFRMLNDDGAFNYHDLLLAKSAEDGAVRVIDLYVYAAGEPLSESLRRFYIIGAAAEGKTTWEKLFGADPSRQADFQHMQQILTLHRSGRFAEALPIFDKLTPEFRNEKPLLLARAQIAAQVEGGEAEYIAALEDFRRRYSDDAAADVHAVDYFFLRGEYAEALAAVDRIDQAVKGDPNLHALRSSIHLEAGDLDAALAAAKQAIAEEETLLNAYWAWVAVTLKQRDFDATLHALRTMSERFPLEFDDLTQIPEYAEFVRSPQYQQWLSEQE